MRKTFEHKPLQTMLSLTEKTETVLRTPDNIWRNLKGKSLKNLYLTVCKTRIQKCTKSCPNYDIKVEIKINTSLIGDKETRIKKLLHREK